VLFKQRKIDQVQGNMKQLRLTPVYSTVAQQHEDVEHTSRHFM